MIPSRFVGTVDRQLHHGQHSAREHKSEREAQLTADLAKQPLRITSATEELSDTAHVVLEW